MVNPLLPFRGENETKEYFLNEYLPLYLANRENALSERRAHLEFIQRHFRLPYNPCLLDVGCALGAMLSVARDLGWQAAGVETSAFAARYAAEQTGCPVFIGTLQQAAFSGGSFDVITLMDVIEHIPAPAGMIAEIHRILRPGGVVYLVTPNFSSLSVRLYGLDAYGIWPDQHVVYFTPPSVRMLLRQNGFRRIVVKTKDVYAGNLQRLLRRPQPSVGSEIKAAFGDRSALRSARSVANFFFAHVLVGDKLIAGAQK